jgi:putative YpdA family bacillithiol system oxidoreductase
MAYQLPVHTYEAVQQIEKSSDIDARFEISTSKARYRTKNLILSTGFYDDANLLNVPGENLPKVRHYYNEPHPYALQKVAIIGGGNSAVDAALETYRCNAEVSLIVREKELKEGVKYWVRPDIENRIREGAIKAYFEAQVLEITPKSLIIRDKEGKKMEFANDFVLAMTGYKPNYDILERLGVHLTEGALKVPEYDADTQQTNVAGLYLAGVICGGMQTNRWFIENTRDHGEKIAAHIQKAVN